MTLDELNAMPSTQARDALLQCCGSTRWADAMVARRPFGNRTELYAAAEETWWSLAANDWREAFAAHPRIGDRGTGWSSEEQAGTRDAAADTLASLARRNRDYEARFGHVFLICATGRGAGEMLANLEERMNNEPTAEVRIAAGEQARITRLRLEKLLGAGLEADT